MRNGICPRCGHNDIRAGKQQLTELIAANQTLGVQAIMANVRVQYEVYVCTYCG